MASTGDNGIAERHSATCEQAGRADDSYRLALGVYHGRRESITRRIFERLNSKYRFVAWQDAEDAYADLFPRALMGFSFGKLSATREDVETATENFLVKAGINRAIDRYRHERGWSMTAGADAGGKREIPTDPQVLLDRADQPVDQLEARTQVQAMFAESMKLPEKDRKMFWAHHFKGQKIREIAAEREVSERWVKKRISLFRMQLEALHGRPALVPLFLHQLYWRLRDVVTPASTVVAQQEPISAGLVKVCAVSCVLIVGGVGAQTAYKQVEKRPHTGKRQVAARTAGGPAPAPSAYSAAPAPQAEGSTVDPAKPRGSRAGDGGASPRSKRRGETAKREQTKTEDHATASPTARVEETKTEGATTPKQRRRQVARSPAPGAGGKPASAAASGPDVGALDP